MAVLILIALIALPLAEIFVYVEVGARIGPWPTVALTVLTALAGLGLLRRQGLSTLGRLRAALGRDELPATELFHGACVLLAGALLLIPGFLSDVAGLLLFIPALRDALGRHLWKHASLHGRIWIDRQPAPRPGGRVIEVEYEELSADRSEPDDRPRGN